MTSASQRCSCIYATAKDQNSIESKCVSGRSQPLSSPPADRAPSIEARIRRRGRSLPLRPRDAPRPDSRSSLRQKFARAPGIIIIISSDGGVLWLNRTRWPSRAWRSSWGTPRRCRSTSAAPGRGARLRVRWTWRRRARRVRRAAAPSGWSRRRGEMVSEQVAWEFGDECWAARWGCGIRR